MICISITNSSNRFAVVDMYNAAGQCDMMELRLDRIEHSPDVTLLLETKQKPVLVSCRRKQDGGDWKGSEDQRLVLLRQAIVEGAEYVELEMDVADKVPRYGKTKRVISHTSLDQPYRDLETLYRRACSLDADVVKFTAPTNTLEEAWPMLRVLAKREVPTVAVGIGEPGLTLSVLGRKLNSPWVYAALEQGMEAYVGQATAAQLRDVYHYYAMKPSTKLVGISGFNPRQQLALCLLNGAFQQLGLNQRCLPMELGDINHFEPLMKALHVGGVVLDIEDRSRILQVVTQLEESAKLCRQADLVLKQKDVWYGYNTLWRSAVRALEEALRKKTGDDKPLEGRSVLMGGATATARAIAYGIQRRGSLLMVTSRDVDRATLMAQMYQCRYIPATHIYSVYTDCLVCLEEDAPGEHDGDPPRPLIEEHFLRPSHTVMDLRRIPDDTRLLKEVRVRQCTVVESMDVFLEQLCQQLRGLTGKEVTTEEMRQWVGAKT